MLTFTTYSSLGTKQNISLYPVTSLRHMCKHHTANLCSHVCFDHFLSSGYWWWQAGSQTSSGHWHAVNMSKICIHPTNALYLHQLQLVLLTSISRSKKSTNLLQWQSGSQLMALAPTFLVITVLRTSTCLVFVSYISTNHFVLNKNCR